MWDRPNNPANFFSFFTIESNILAAAVLLYGAARPALVGRAQTSILVRGAAVLYMTVTFIVYGVLLSGYQEELQTTIPWVDTVVHRVLPIVMILDWIIDPPDNALTWRRALPFWLVPPAAYLVYSLIRGPIVDWYPYPFLNPDEVGGYAGVAAYGSVSPPWPLSEPGSSSGSATEFASPWPPSQPSAKNLTTSGIDLGGSARDSKSQAHLWTSSQAGLSRRSISKVTFNLSPGGTSER